MRVERGGVVQVIGTGIVIEIVTERENDTENVIVKGLENGMVEVVVMEEGGLIGEAGLGTVIAADHVPLLGMVTGGHLEVQFASISGLCG